MNTLERVQRFAEKDLEYPLLDVTDPQTTQTTKTKAYVLTVRKLHTVACL